MKSYFFEVYNVPTSALIMQISLRLFPMLFRWSKMVTCTAWPDPKLFQSDLRSLRPTELHSARSTETWSPRTCWKCPHCTGRRGSSNSSTKKMQNWSSVLQAVFTVSSHTCIFCEWLIVLYRINTLKLAKCYKKCFLIVKNRLKVN